MIVKLTDALRKQLYKYSVNVTCLFQIRVNMIYFQDLSLQNIVQLWCHLIKCSNLSNCMHFWCDYDCIQVDFMVRFILQHASNGLLIKNDCGLSSMSTNETAKRIKERGSYYFTIWIKFQTKLIVAALFFIPYTL